MTTPLGVMGLLGFAIGGIAITIKKCGWGIAYRLFPVVIFLLTYWFAVIASGRGSGPRHLLPAYAAMCVLIGGVLWLRFPRPWNLVVAGTGLLGVAAASFGVRPHYLSYFNEFAGGSKEGYRHLSDSGVDWGQDLPELSAKLSAIRGDLPVYLAYFGTARPEYYGIHAKPLVSFPEWSSPQKPESLGPGLYCISATLLDNMYTTYAGNYDRDMELSYQNLRMGMKMYEAEQLKRGPAGKWSEREQADIALLHERFRQIRFTRLCAYLRKREPIERAGYSINIYGLTAEDVKRAADGPPPFDFENGDPAPR
jgi:hypothetical protein